MAELLELVWSALGGAFVTFTLASVAWAQRVERKLSVLETRLGDHPPRVLNDRIQRLATQVQRLEPVIDVLDEEGLGTARALVRRTEPPREEDDPEDGR